MQPRLCKLATRQQFHLYSTTTFLLDGCHSVAYVLQTDLLSHVIFCRWGLTRFRIERCLRRGSHCLPTVDFKWVQQLYRSFQYQMLSLTGCNLDYCCSLIRPSRPFMTSCMIPSFHSPHGRCWSLTITTCPTEIWALLSPGPLFEVWACTSLKLLKYSVCHHFQKRFRTWFRCLTRSAARLVSRVNSLLFRSHTWSKFQQIQNLSTNNPVRRCDGFFHILTRNR